ncbi:nucleotidyl transferase AbiEii/AbiGii toxin family protein [Echinicola marina]|uniref:nucleotidyl transferase AbiEii/AbiGii toxin family protein n=1 Tax=Echinicola marina TaxID=2859768 RepID=UPI001CF60950|nr:nucleotidyl transferase AbiEii/AbiGii toxin family protein [Echinicola marina]UCS93940.1 nucleotidyl transferase AbiEii/AbiGii toxin family protein [Echinicola marina]
MNLHDDKELLQDAILATAEYLGMRDIYVEKDYWVTVALYEIFHSDIASQAVFKGGTALSKCHKLIERFSEDIDMVVLRNEGENDNQLKKKIRTIGKVVEKVIPEIEVEGLTNKMGNIRKTVHEYDKIFKGGFGQVREHVVVEATWLGNFEPFSEMQVSSYIYEMMKGKGQEKLIEKYKMAPFNIRVLSKLRTFCEKIMSLVRFSRSEDPIADLRNKIRHVYDIHQMLKDEEIQRFFESSDFDKMLIKVGNDDMIGYKNNNDWIPEHPSKALIFDKPKETWEHLSTAHNGNFKDLVTGELPLEKALIQNISTVADRLREIIWEIK